VDIKIDWSLETPPDESWSLGADGVDVGPVVGCIVGTVVRSTVGLKVGNVGEWREGRGDGWVKGCTVG
jgi:hypothetical protein